MSNDQWNNVPGTDPQPQSAPHDSSPSTPHDGVSSADPSHGGHWHRPPVEPPIATGQPAGSPGHLAPSETTDWTTGNQNQESANGWTTGAQQQPSAAEWHVQPKQNSQNHPGAGPNAPGQPFAPGPGPHPGQNPQGRPGQGQQYRPMPTRQSNGLANVFDFSFRRLALPEASGAIFLIVVIATGVWWLVDLIYAASFGDGVFNSAAIVGMQLILGGLARSVLIILAARVLLEGMSALVISARRNRETDGS